MNTTCQPLPRLVAEEMLQIVARAICDRPGDTAAQRASRTRQMVYSILGFEPRDGLEYMLATMVVGHFQLILDSMRDALWGQADSVKAKTKTGVVALDRMMLGYVKELRLVRERPVMRRAEDARAPETTSPIDPPDWIAAWAGVPPAEPAAAAAAEPAAPQAKPAPAPARNVPPPAGRPAAPADAKSPTNQPVQPPPDPDDVETAQHIAAFEEALANLSASLEEARSFDATRTEAAVASGD